MNNIELNTYIITLKKNEINDKINTIKNLNPKIIQGINGNLLSNDNYNLKYFKSLFLPKSVIGCAMSHIKCWKKHILKLNNYTLILEDDFFIDDLVFNEYKSNENIKNLNDLIKYFISQTPKNFDILYLGYISGNIINTYFNFINNTNKYKNINTLIEKSQINLGLHSYIISNSGIIKLLDNINTTKINFHLDYYIQKLSSQNILNTFCLKKRLFYQTSTYISNISNNISNFKCPFFKTYFIDNYVTLNYLFNVSIFVLFDFNINLWIIFLFILINIFLIIIIKKQLNKKYYLFNLNNIKVKKQ